MGKTFQLIEINKTDDHYARYDLLREDEITLKAGLVTKPGNCYFS